MSIEALKRIRDETLDLKSPAGTAADSARPSTNSRPDRSGVRAWPEPKPLPNGLAPVESFSSDFCPMRWHRGLKTSRTDCNARPITSRWPRSHHSAQLLGVASASSRKHKPIGLKFQIYGAASSGRPGMLKSPAMMEALKPLHHLEAEAAKAHTKALVDHQGALAEFKLHKSVKESILKEQLKKKVAEKVVSLGGVSSLKDMIKDAQKEIR